MFRCITPEGVSVSAREESVHRDPATSCILPVYRSAFVHEKARSHHLITLIELVPPSDTRRPGPY